MINRISFLDKYSIDILKFKWFNMKRTFYRVTQELEKYEDSDANTLWKHYTSMDFINEYEVNE